MYCTNVLYMCQDMSELEMQTIKTENHKCIPLPQHITVNFEHQLKHEVITMTLLSISGFVFNEMLQILSYFWNKNTQIQ